MEASKSSHNIWGYGDKYGIQIYTVLQLSAYLLMKTLTSNIILEKPLN